MSALPDENVHSMREFLAETLRGADEVDRTFHALRDRVRERLYAMQLAEDPEFLEELHELGRRISEGEQGVDSMTVAEYRARTAV